jgi:hypothetical protein
VRSADAERHSKRDQRTRTIGWKWTGTGSTTHPARVRKAADSTIKARIRLLMGVICSIARKHPKSTSLRTASALIAMRLAGGGRQRGLRGRWSETSRSSRHRVRGTPARAAVGGRPPVPARDRQTRVRWPVRHIEARRKRVNVAPEPLGNGKDVAHHDPRIGPPTLRDHRAGAVVVAALDGITCASLVRPGAGATHFRPAASASCRPARVAATYALPRASW